MSKAACRSLRPGILKTKIPLRRALKKHAGCLQPFIDETEDPLTADGDDVKRQPAGPRPNVDRRSDADRRREQLAKHSCGKLQLKP
jgi:hypothetical protein